ncbi:N-acetylmuramoyl-L-alanine amidase [Enterococcus gallinarum]|uniref:peptidoglycan recognition protein family protein n=1 Tax=Enterococcus gallinarum TaxID=1353 RepID=UPI0035CA574D
MSFIKYEYIRINKFSRPGIKNYGIKGIIMHYTANNGGTARNHKDYFNNLNSVYASAHLFVDDNEAICMIPLDEVAYHANDTVRYNSDGSIYKPLYSQIGNANYGAIGVEMCLDRNGNITEKTFQNTVKAVKELIAKYPNITRNKIWRHYDVTGKNCPAPWVAKPSELERFKDAVFGKTSGSNSAAKPSTPSAKPSTNKIPEDGMFGPSTANKAMKYEGITPDDEISHQYRQSCNKNLYAAQFDNTLKGSTLIRTWQKRLKAKGLYNGAIDGLCGTEMIKAMQRALKTTVDGVISPVSNMVKALQVALNNNKLPW